MTKDELRQVLRRREALWPRELNDEQTVAWMAALLPLPFDAAMKALAKLYATKKFAPKICEVMEAAKGFMARETARRPEAELPAKLRALVPDHARYSDVELLTLEGRCLYNRHVRDTCTNSKGEIVKPLRPGLRQREIRYLERDLLDLGHDPAASRHHAETVFGDDADAYQMALNAVHHHGLARTGDADAFAA